MANIIKLKRSETSGSAPSSGDLEVGEVCMNIVDGVLYTKKIDGTIVTVSDKTTGHADIELVSLDTSSSAGPGIDLFRNSFSPFSSDEIGKIDFSGENDNSDKKVYAKVVSKINDATNTAEIGELELHVMNEGTVENILIVKSDGIHLSSPTKGITFGDGTNMLTAASGTGGGGPHTHTALIIDGTTVTTSETNGHTHTIFCIDGTSAVTSSAGVPEEINPIVMSIALG